MSRIELGASAAAERGSGPSDAPPAIRENLVAAHHRAWERLAAAGTW